MGPTRVQPRGGTDSQLRDVKALQDADAPVSVAGNSCTTCPAATSRASRPGAPSTREVQPADSRSPPTSTRWCARAIRERSTRRPVAGAGAKDALGRPLNHWYTSRRGPRTAKFNRPGQLRLLLGSGVCSTSASLLRGSCRGWPDDRRMQDFGEHTLPDDPFGRTACLGLRRCTTSIPSSTPTGRGGRVRPSRRRSRSPGLIPVGVDRGVQRYAQPASGRRSRRSTGGSTGPSSAVTQGLTMGSLGDLPLGVCYLRPPSRWNQRLPSPELLAPLVDPVRRGCRAPACARRRTGSLSLRGRPRPQIP